MMRKLLALVFLISSIQSYSQFNVVPRSTGSNTVQDVRVDIKSNLFIPRYFDTTTANLPINIGVDSSGAIIKTYNPDAVWIRGSKPKRWINLIATGSPGSFALVATTGDFNDLINKPNINVSVIATTLAELRSKNTTTDMVYNIIDYGGGKFLDKGVNTGGTHVDDTARIIVSANGHYLERTEFNGSIRPEWYGITGTNDQIAINKALTQVGVKVILSPITYNTSAPIRMTKGQILEGNNATIVSTSATSIIEGKTELLTSVYQHIGVTISDVTLKSATATQAINLKGFTHSNIINPTIELTNVDVNDVGIHFEHGSLNYQYCYFNKLTNPSIYLDGPGTAILIDGVEGVSGANVNSIIGGKVSGMDQYAVRIKNHSTGNIITNLDAEHFNPSTGAIAYLIESSGNTFTAPHVENYPAVMKLTELANGNIVTGITAAAYTTLIEDVSSDHNIYLGPNSTGNIGLSIGASPEFGNSTKLRIAGTQYPSIRIDSKNASDLSRNWALRAGFDGSDFDFMRSSTKGGDPVTGTAMWSVNPQGHFVLPQSIKIPNLGTYNTNTLAINDGWSNGFFYTTPDGIVRSVKSSVTGTHVELATAGDHAPQWQQVQAAIAASGGGSGVFAVSGNNIYNTNSGLVGLGTTDPLEKLDVSSFEDLTRVRIGYSTVTTAGLNLEWNNGNGRAQISTRNNSPIFLGVNNRRQINVNGMGMTIGETLSYFNTLPPENGLLVEGKIISNSTVAGLDATVNNEYVTLQQLNNAATGATTLAQLKSATTTTGKIYTITDMGSGTFLDLGLNDGQYNIDGFIYVTTGNNHVVKRQYNGAIFFEWFGAKGDGTTDNTTPVNAGIDYANSLNPTIVDAPNVKGTKLQFGIGTFLLPNSLHPILRSGISIMGTSREGTTLITSGDGVTFDWGGTNGYLVGGEMGNFKLERPGASGNSIAIQVQNAHRISFHDIELVNMGTVFNLGTSDSRPATGITMVNISGYIFNGGESFCRVNYGTGLDISNVKPFVGSVLPPTVDRTSTMTTIPLTNAFTFTGWWDTFIMNNSQFWGFDYGIYALADAKVIQSFTVTHTYFDYSKTTAIYLHGINGGIVSTVNFTDCWFASWEGDAIRLAANVIGANFTGGDIVSAGNNGIYIGTTGNSQISVNNMIINGVNRTSGVYFGIAQFGGKSINLIGNHISSKVVGGSFPWRNFAAIEIDPTVDDLIVTGNELYGDYGAIYAEPAVEGVHRIIKDNLPDTTEVFEIEHKIGFGTKTPQTKYSFGVNGGIPSPVISAQAFGTTRVAELGTLPKIYPNSIVPDSPYYASGLYINGYAPNVGPDTLAKFSPEGNIWAKGKVSGLDATDSSDLITLRQFKRFTNGLSTGGTIDQSNLVHIVGDEVIGSEKTFAAIKIGSVATMNNGSAFSWGYGDGTTSIIADATNPTGYMDFYTAFVKRLHIGYNGTIQFYSPITVPNATISTQAVNLSQLNAAIAAGSPGSQFKIAIPAGVGIPVISVSSTDSTVTAKRFILEGPNVNIVTNNDTLIRYKLSPRIATNTTTAVITPDFQFDDGVKVLALASDVTVANPIGTGTGFQRIIFRIRDNGTARAISWGTKYRPIGVTLPTTTVAGKLLYVEAIFNADDNTGMLDVIRVNQEL